MKPSGTTKKLSSNKYNEYAYSSGHKSRNSLTPLSINSGVSSTFDSYSNALPSKLLNLSDQQMRVHLENKNDDQTFKTLTAIQRIFDKINKRKHYPLKRKRMGTNPCDNSKFKFYKNKIDEATETLKLPQISGKISRGIDGPKERFDFGDINSSPNKYADKGN